jgi:hypothetical protein
LNPIVARAFRSAVRPRAVLGMIVAALLVLAASWVLAPNADDATGLRVHPGYLGLCRAELFVLLLVVGITAGASIAAERQEGTWDALALSSLSDTDLVVGKAADVLPRAILLATLLVPAHLAVGIFGGAPRAVIVAVQAVFLGAGVGVAGLGLFCSAACQRVLHAVALAAAAIILGWFAALDGLAYAWPTSGLVSAHAGHPLRLIDNLVTTSLSARVARLRVVAFVIGTGLAGGLAFLGAIRLARCSVQGRALALPSLFRVRPGATEHVWDDPIYWRECRSRGARRVGRIGGLLMLLLAVFLTLTQRDPARGGLWAQVWDLAPNYMNLLINVGMPMLCLRASVTIVDERRRGMLAPLALAGISPALLVGSKLKGALRPALPLTALVLILWVSLAAEINGRLIDLRLWLDAIVALAAVGAGYFVAVSLGLLASSCAPSLRVALPVAVALLVAWDNVSPLVPNFLRSRAVISSDTLMWLFQVIGGGPSSGIIALTRHVARLEPYVPAVWVVCWVAFTTLVGLAACLGAIFRVSREHRGGHRFVFLRLR